MTLQGRYPVALRLYPYRRSDDQDAARPTRHPVVIAGAGPTGLAVALDLGRKGHRVVVLDDHEGVGLGSRAICFSKRTLEIAHRLGPGPGMLDSGVIWQKGRVFRDRDEIYSFDLLPEEGHRYPAFINLSQVQFEKFLFEAIEHARADGAEIEIRGGNRVDALDASPDGIRIDVMTPEGAYSLEADWLIACDGARSPVRNMLGLGFTGRVFEDNFLIADVRMTADFPTERWFWFEPWFRSGDSALLHKQPDGIWRIDFQIGWDIDRDEELKEESILARVDAMLGKGVEYELVWSSIYTFQCRRMERFRHGRVLFAGDSAHQVSPYGARGANSGVQDAENLAWKLDFVIGGLAPETLLDGYDAERIHAADENILNSTRSTDFLTPKSEISRTFRDAVLTLAARHSFARPLVNSGRLSVPCTYDGLPGFGPDMLGQPARSRPGAPAPDAPVGDGYLLDLLGGEFTLLGLGLDVPESTQVDGISVAGLALSDASIGDLLRERYLGAAASAAYLFRPDQHVVARWPELDLEAVRASARNAVGKGAE